jgi:hypothetical protein
MKTNVNLAVLSTAVVLLAGCTTQNETVFQQAVANHNATLAGCSQISDPETRADCVRRENNRWLGYLNYAQSVVQANAMMRASTPQIPVQNQSVPWVQPPTQYNPVPYGYDPYWPNAPGQS